MKLNDVVDARRRALLGVGLASVMAAAGCGGGGGGEAPAPQIPPVDNPPPVVNPPATVLGTWQPAVQLDAGDGLNIEFSEPVVAFDGNRGGMAVWVRVDTVGAHLWASRLMQDGTWSPAEQIDGAVNAQAVGAAQTANPHLVVDAAGNALVVWECTEASRTSIAVNRFDAATSKWGDAFELPKNVVTSVINPGHTNAVSPSIAMDAAGNAVAVWSQAADAQSRTRIVSNTFTLGLGWGAEEKVIAEGTNEDSVNPQVVMDASGRALAIWQRTRVNQPTVLASSRLEAGAAAWSPVMGVGNEIIAGSQETPHLAMAPNGDAMVVWQFMDIPEKTGVFARRLLAASAQWEATKVVEGVVTGKMPARPHVAMTTGGDAIVVWDEVVEDVGGVRAVFASRFHAEEGQAPDWTDAVRLKKEAGGHGQGARIAAANAAGNAVVIWVQTAQDGVPQALGASYRADTDAWTVSKDFEKKAGDSFTPQVAMRADGTALAVWSKQTKILADASIEGSLWTAEFK